MGAVMVADEGIVRRVDAQTSLLINICCQLSAAKPSERSISMEVMGRWPRIHFHDGKLSASKLGLTMSDVMMVFRSIYHNTVTVLMS